MATNGRKLATQQSVNAAVKQICDIMRRSNCAGALHYVPELTPQQPQKGCSPCRT
jgi:type I restriction enzyme M protein